MRATILLATVAAAAVLAGCYDTGPLMRPGENCMSCHDGSPAPKWRVAGTVFECKDAAKGEGLEGVRITLTDPDGAVVLELDSNAAGNFYSDQSPGESFRVKVSKDGVVREMPILATSGACNSCHKVPPANGAPGRIYLNQADCPPPGTDVPASGDDL